jgi:hypothetical protein
MYPISRNNSAPSCSIRCNRRALPPSCSARLLSGNSLTAALTWFYWRRMGSALQRGHAGPRRFFANRFWAARSPCTQPNGPSANMAGSASCFLSREGSQLWSDSRLALGLEPAARYSDPQPVPINQVGNGGSAERVGDHRGDQRENGQPREHRDSQI